MFRSLRFSILDLVALTTGLAMFAFNFVSRELILVRPIPGERFWEIGFPVVWSRYKTPMDDSVWEMATEKSHLIALNAVLCAAIAIVFAMLARKVPKWVTRTRTPKSNPARVLLYVFGCLMSVSAVATMSYSDHWRMDRIAPLMGLLFGGVLAILLARRVFNSLSKTLTIGWGVLATMALLYLFFVVDPIAYPPQPYDYPGIALALVLTASLMGVAWLAWRKPAFLTDSVAA